MRKVISFCMICLCLNAVGQADTTRNKRLNTVITVGAIGYGVSIYALSQLWYKESGFTSFHFFNDNDQWNQMDKAGHFFTPYQLSRIGDNVLSWSGVEDKKAALWGSIIGTAILIPIEILDGFSPDYGFSYGDMIANLAGSAFYLGQDLLWNEQRIKPKFSFHQTSLAKVSPDLLGEGLAQEIFKDYNGQTYWLSFDVRAFAKKSKFPKWLNLAVGYGTHEMVRAREDQNNTEGFYSYRQGYLGIDFDLTAIKTSKKWLKTTLFILDAFKLPAPTLEFSKNGSKFHFFYY